MKTIGLILGFILLAIPGLAQEATAEPSQEAKEIPSPREGLIPVPLPNLASAEAMVADQLDRFQRSLQDSIAAGTPDLELSNAYGLLAMVYHAYDIRISAVPAYENARTLAPDEFKWPYLVALLYLERGDTQDAIRAFSRATELQPGYTAAWAYLGDCHAQFNHWEVAEEHYRKALELNPQSAHAYNGIGQLMIGQKKYQEAIPLLEKAAGYAPEANRIQYSLARAYRAMGDMESAKVYIARSGKVGVTENDPLEQSLQRYLRGERVFMARGKSAFNAKRFEEAAEAFSQAVASKPDSIRARVNLATTLVYLGRNNEAIDQFQKILQEQPGHPTALYNLAATYESGGNLDQAEALFTQFLSTNPDDLTAQLRLAHTLYKQGKSQDALDLYNRVKSLQPLDQEGYLNLTSLLRGQKKHADVLAVLEEAHERMPDQGLIVHALARALVTSPQAELRDGKRALDLAQKVAAVSNQAQHLQTLALAYAEVDDCDQAVAWQTKALEAAQATGNQALIQQMSDNLAYLRQTRPCRAPLAQAAE